VRVPAVGARRQAWVASGGGANLAPRGSSAITLTRKWVSGKKPTFNEEYYGYDTFSDLLEDAQSNNIIKIKKDIKSGSYVITGFAQPAA